MTEEVNNTHSPSERVSVIVLRVLAIVVVGVCIVGKDLALRDNARDAAA